ncbi:MAG: hypothetical protein AVDCRST_MAG19-2044, partial [uncultured Thermomicrobiales bacterium]
GRRPRLAVETGRQNPRRRPRRDPVRSAKTLGRGRRRRRGQAPGLPVAGRRV